MKEKIVWLKETILYYIVSLYMHTWMFQKIFLRIHMLENELKRCDDKADAEYIASRKMYKYISKSFKQKMIHEKFD